MQKTDSDTSGWENEINTGNTSHPKGSDYSFFGSIFVSSIYKVVGFILITSSVS
jgi:hypothetical protein